MKVFQVEFKKVINAPEQKKSLEEDLKMYLEKISCFYNIFWLLIPVVEAITISAVIKYV